VWKTAVDGQMDELSDNLNAHKTTIARLEEKMAEDEAIDDDFRLVDIPEKLKVIENELSELQDIAGDASGDLDRLTVIVSENTEARKQQLLRAATRIEQHKIRDVNIESLRQAIQEVEDWRNSLSVGRVEVLNSRINQLQNELNAVIARQKYEDAEAGEFP